MAKNFLGTSGSAVTVIDAMSDPAIWGHLFAPLSSWWPWMVALKTLFGLPLEGDEEIAFFQKCTGRTTVPTEGFAEAWWIVGRRGGKSRILALIAAYLAVFRDVRPYLAAGERATIAVISRDRTQSRIIFKYLRSLLIDGPPAIAALVSRETATAIDLTTGVSIEIHTAHHASIRGLSTLALLADEAAHWETDTDAANLDEEILAAARPGLTTIEGALLLVGSNPHAQRGAV